jgi:hypothetical protein
MKGKDESVIYDLTSSPLLQMLLDLQNGGNASVYPL